MREKNKRLDLSKLETTKVSKQEEGNKTEIAVDSNQIAYNTFVPFEINKDLVNVLQLHEHHTFINSIGLNEEEENKLFEKINKHFSSLVTFLEPLEAVIAIEMGWVDYDNLDEHGHPIINSPFKNFKLYSFLLPSDKDKIISDFKCCQSLTESIKKLNLTGSIRKYLQILESRIEKTAYLMIISKDDDTVTNLLESNLILYTRRILKHLFLHICLETGWNYLLFKVGRKGNKYRIELIKELKKGEYPLRFSIEDISDILEGISLIYPEFKFPEKPKKAIEPELFRKGNLQATSSSLVTDACYSFFVGKTLSFSKLTEGFMASKSFGVGSIDIIIREAKEAILNEYGEDTLKIFYSLVGYSMEKGRRFNEVITVSGRDILGYLNKKYERDSKGKRVKRIESLEWLAHHCNLLERIKVFSGGITPNGKGKKSFSILETPLITFDAIEYDCQLDIYGKPDRSKIYDLHITFKPGGWFEKFYDEDNLKNLGYVHKEALASNGIGSKILSWLVFKLEQHQSGDFKIKTILEDIGFKAKLEEILSDYKKKKNKAQNLYRDFNKAIEELKQIEDPYPIEYRNPPEWLLDSSKRKSNGWFKQWLNTVIIFKHPLCLIGESKSSRREKKINSTPKKEKSKLTVEDLKSAIDSNPQVSIRKLTIWYGEKHPWLQRRLKNNDLNQTEIKDLLNGVKQLSKK